MMLKHEEIHNPDSCLSKASFVEPIFVLRAQDFSAPLVVEYWLSLNPSIPEEKRQEALAWVEAAREWPSRRLAD